MRSWLLNYACLFICLPLLHSPAVSQPATPSFAVTKDEIKKGLFERDEILQIRIAGKLNELLNDRGEKPVYHSLGFSYLAEDSTTISMPVQIKTRGHFRKDKTNCTWPPLLINFSKQTIPNSSLFEGQHKLKLVMPCRGDEYVVKEWLLYKLYNLVTPKSFRARLVRVTMEDSIKRKQTSFFGILLEDDGEMAHRNKTMVVQRKLLNPLNTEPGLFLTMAVFQYMIGNTDWSVQYQQNICLVAKDSLGTAFTVPYDFDHAGLVSAPYAKPAEELEMSSVTERRYRGYCITDMKTYDSVIAVYNKLKNDFYKVYTECAFLDTRDKKVVFSYLDEFYSTINNPKALQAAFSYPCNKYGTGNVIIKGLKKD